GRIEGARAARDLAAEQTLGPALDRLLDLAMEVVTQVHARLRPDLRLARQRIAHATRPELVDELRDELLGDRLDDDESLGGDAALAAVDQARVGRSGGGEVEIRIFQDDERVAAAELEHGLLEHLPSPLSDLASGQLAARERDRDDPRIVDEAGDRRGFDQR